MTGGSCSYTLGISEHLFRLTTESLRLHSNDTGQFETLANLLNDRMAATSATDDQSPNAVRDHLSAVPTDGTIPITLEITKSSADSLDDLKARFGKSLGSDITLGDAVSIVLFQYVVAQKTSKLMKRLGLEDADNSAIPDGNVVSIR